jgi:hypothetical protein
MSYRRPILNEWMSAVASIVDLVAELKTEDEINVDSKDGLAVEFNDRSDEPEACAAVMLEAHMRENRYSPIKDRCSLNLNPTPPPMTGPVATASTAPEKSLALYLAAANPAKPWTLHASLKSQRTTASAEIE